MRNVIILIICSFIFWNLSFVSADEITCKENIMVNSYSPIFSDDWKDFAYIINQDDLWKIVLNWKEVVKENDKINEIKFLNNSKAIVYTLWNSWYNEEWKIYWNWSGIDKKVFISDSNTIYDLSFSSDLSNYAYSYFDWSYHIINNWKDLWVSYDNVLQITYSPDWKKFAYSVEHNWVKFVEMNWKKIWWEYDTIFDLKFSPDWKNLFFSAQKKWKWMIVTNWVEWKEYNTIFSPTYSPDWNSFSYIARDDTNQYIIKDWVKIWNDYKWVNSFLYSLKWNNFAYIAAKENYKYVVVLNWKEISQEYDWIIDLKFSQDGKNLSYKAETNWSQNLIKDWKLVWIDDWYINDFTYLQWTDKLSYISTKNKNVNITINENKVNSNFTYLDDFHKVKFSNNTNKIAYETWKDWVNYVAYFSCESKSKIIKVPEKIINTNIDKISDSNNTCKEEFIENASNPVFSPDWLHYAYVLNLSKWDEPADSCKPNNDNCYIIKDWIELWKWVNPIFSPDWKSFSYIWTNSWKIFLVKDWKKIWEEFDFISQINYKLPMYYSNDWSKVWLIWNIWNICDWYVKSYIFENGKKIWEWGELVISPDWKHYSYVNYVSHNVTYNDWVKLWFWDSPSYSSDWKSFAYTKKENWENYVVKDWITIQKWYSQIFSPDWKSFAYITWKNWELFNGWKLYLVNNWKETLIKYTRAYWLVYSPNGDSIAYIWWDWEYPNYNSYVVKDWVELDSANLIDNLNYSPDGKSFSYRKSDNNGWYYIIKDWVSLWNQSISLIYSSDWKSFSYNKWSSIFKDWKYLWVWRDLVYWINNETFAYNLYENWVRWLYLKTCKNNNPIINKDNFEPTISKNYTKLLIISKSNLNKTSKWKKYLTQIDSIVWKLDNIKLEKILNKILKIENRWKYQDIFDYLEASIALKLWK
jgi:hypothetical protein